MREEGRGRGEKGRKKEGGQTDTVGERGGDLTAGGWCHPDAAVVCSSAIDEGKKEREESHQMERGGERGREKRRLGASTRVSLSAKAE